VTDNRVLWDLDAQNANALFGEALNTDRASIGLPPVDNVRHHVFTDQPRLATDPTLGLWQPTDLDVVQTGAWILPDERPLPSELVAPGRRHTTGVCGLRQHGNADPALRAPKDVAPGGHRCRGPRRRRWACWLRGSGITARIPRRRSSALVPHAE
jgi:hypothetical protein